MQDVLHLLIGDANYECCLIQLDYFLYYWKEYKLDHVDYI